MAATIAQPGKIGQSLLFPRIPPELARWTGHVGNWTGLLKYFGYQYRARQRGGGRVISTRRLVSFGGADRITGPERARHFCAVFFSVARCAPAVCFSTRQQLAHDCGLYRHFDYGGRAHDFGWRMADFLYRWPSHVVYLDASTANN